MVTLKAECHSWWMWFFMTLNCVIHWVLLLTQPNWVLREPMFQPFHLWDLTAIISPWTKWMKCTFIFSLSADSHVFLQYRKSGYCFHVAFLFRTTRYSSRSAESQSAWRDSFLMYKILRNARTASCKSLIEVNETNPHFLFTTTARLTRSHRSFEPSISAALRGEDFMNFLIKKKKSWSICLGQQVT